MLKLRHGGIGWAGRVFGGLLLCCALLQPAQASVTILVGEPYGSFGTMMPVGHAAVYLDHLCADGPLKLRACQPGEPEGVVIARYHQIGALDWVATPVMQFLYATDQANDVLPYATAESVWELRQTYRRRYLEAIVPDGTERNKATDEWSEMAGAAFDRRLWGYSLTTTREQDERVMAWVNAMPNRHLYHLRKTNCADFAAAIVNLYYPGSVRGADPIADFGVMSPKQVVRSIETFGAAHPEADLRVLEIPQVPGEQRRSRPTRGGVEALLKTKRYLFTLLAIQPEVPVGLAILYLDHGRWRMGQNAALATPDEFQRNVPGMMVAGSAGSGQRSDDSALIGTGQALEY